MAQALLQRRLAAAGAVDPSAPRIPFEELCQLYLEEYTIRQYRTPDTAVVAGEETVQADETMRGAHSPLIVAGPRRRRRRAALAIREPEAISEEAIDRNSQASETRIGLDLGSLERGPTLHSSDEQPKLLPLRRGASGRLHVASPRPFLLPPTDSVSPSCSPPFSSR